MQHVEILAVYQTPSTEQWDCYATVATNFQ